MLLSLSAAHSCMGTAINYYFNCKVFRSLAEFHRRQIRLRTRIHHRSEQPFTGNLMARVRVGRFDYRRRIIWNWYHHMRADIPTRVGTRGGRCILDYLDNHRRGHVEAANLIGGRVSIRGTRRFDIAANVRDYAERIS